MITMIRKRTMKTRMTTMMKSVVKIVLGLMMSAGTVVNIAKKMMAIFGI